MNKKYVTIVIIVFLLVVGTFSLLSLNVSKDSKKNNTTTSETTTTETSQESDNPEEPTSIPQEDNSNPTDATTSKVDKPNNTTTTVKTNPVVTPVTKTTKKESIEEKLERLINQDFYQAVSKKQISRYEYLYQIDNNLKHKIESTNNTKLDYSKNRFYEVNLNTLGIISGYTYIYDSSTKHVIKVDTKGNKNISTWFWCDSVNHKILSNQTSQEDFFNKLSKYNITEIYFYINHKNLNHPNVKTFIKNAYNKNIRIYLCVGERYYLNTNTYQESIYDIFNAVDSYNKSSNYNERLAGVTYDAEVWTERSNNWKTDINVRNQHLSYIKESKRYADTKGLSVIFTLPFWIVQYDTSYGNMYDEITKVINKTTLMVYRDDLNKLKNLVMKNQENATATLIDIANKNNCVLDIAVETDYSDEGDQVSFYEEELENPGYLLYTLKQLDYSLNNYKNYMFSIHHAMSLINNFQNGLN